MSRLRNALRRRIDELPAYFPPLTRDDFRNELERLLAIPDEPHVAAVTDLLKAQLAILESIDNRLPKPRQFGEASLGDIAFLVHRLTEAVQVLGTRLRRPGPGACEHDFVVREIGGGARRVVCVGCERDRMEIELEASA